MTLLSRPGDAPSPTMTGMSSPPRRRSGDPHSDSVAVLTIRRLDDGTDDAGRFRVSSCLAVGALPEERRVLIGRDQLRDELCRWVGTVIDGALPPELS